MIWFVFWSYADEISFILRTYSIRLQKLPSSPTSQGCWILSKLYYPKHCLSSIYTLVNVYSSSFSVDLIIALLSFFSLRFLHFPFAEPCVPCLLSRFWVETSISQQSSHLIPSMPQQCIFLLLHSFLSWDYLIYILHILVLYRQCAQLLIRLTHPLCLWSTDAWFNSQYVIQISKQLL